MRPRLTLEEEFEARRISRALGYSLTYVRDFIRREKRKSEKRFYEMVKSWWAT